jgi:hypothetical protein
LAIAQHDNGWWETDALPALGEDDHLPLGLAEILSDQSDGIVRWRAGIDRFRESHPYVSLLISHHAERLYAPKVSRDTDPAWRHPLFGPGPPSLAEGREREQAIDFLKELEVIQTDLVAMLRRDPETHRWADPAHLLPHARLLQVLDGLSLALGAEVVPGFEGPPRGRGEDAFDLNDVPRRSWDDRVTLEVRPAGLRRIACNPYPFHRDPLTVKVPVRIFRGGLGSADEFFSAWYATEPELIAFDYVSKP